MVDLAVSNNSAVAPRRQGSIESSDISARTAWLILVAISLLGAGLRLYRLDAQSIWLDEVASLRNAHAFATGGMGALAKLDHIAPLHSIILWAATALGGETAFAMRLPSAIAGILTIPAFYLLALRLFGSRRVGLIGAALVAVSPYAIWYAQEARMYALLLLCATVYVALAWPIVSRPLRVWELLLLTFVTAIGFYSHHYMVLMSAAFGLFLVIRGGLTQGRAWAWLTTQIVAFLSFMYWLVLTADKLDANAGFSKPLLLLWTPYTFFTFIVGQSFGPSVRDIHVEGVGDALLLNAIPIGIPAVASIILIAGGVRRLMRPDLRVAGLWLAIWLVVPIGLAILATFVTNIHYNVRYVIISYPPIVLLIALAISDMRWLRLPAVKAGGTNAVELPDSRPYLSGLAANTWKWSRLLACLVLAGCAIVSLFNWYFDKDYGKEEVRPLAALLSHDSSDKLVIIDNSRLTLLLAYYGATLPPGSLEIDNIQWARTPETTVEALKQLAGRLPHDIWLVEYRSWETDPAGSVKALLKTMANPIDERDWPGVSLRRYRIHPDLTSDRD